MADNADHIASYILAKNEAEVLTDYLARGRSLRPLSDLQLRERFLQLMTVWASLSEPVSSPLGFNDTMAEASLRSLELPPAPQQLEAIRRKVERAGIDPEALRDDVEDYFLDLGRRQ